jgi:succinyl-diaminopimelate desuccinylase
MTFETASHPSLTPPSPTLLMAQDLIKRASITPEDAGCQALMMDFLKHLGFSIKTYNADGVSNFWAIKGTEGPTFCFAGHTDVVPTGPLEHWERPPFEPTIEKGFLWGRGAADMKGSLASMLIATERFLNNHPNHKGSLAFLITSDEEGPAIKGTDYVVDQLMAQGTKIDMCLVGEPSSTHQLGDRVKNGRRGSLSGELRVIGKQGHIAYPHLAQNPIHLATPALNALINEPWDHGNDFFPATSFQISNIQGGTGAGNVIPGSLDISFNFRFSTEVTADLLKSRVEAILNRFNLHYELSWRLFGNPFLTEQGPLIDAAKSVIKDVLGIDTQLSTSGGTSDGRYIARMGAQILEFGPSNATIHQMNECVKAEDLEQLSLCYEQILNRLLS